MCYKSRFKLNFTIKIEMLYPSIHLTFLKFSILVLACVLHEWRVLYGAVLILSLIATQSPVSSEHYGTAE